MVIIGNKCDRCGKIIKDGKCGCMPIDGFFINGAYVGIRRTHKNKPSSIRNDHQRIQSK